MMRTSISKLTAAIGMAACAVIAVVGFEGCGDDSTLGPDHDDGGSTEDARGSDAPASLTDAGGPVDSGDASDSGDALAGDGGCDVTKPFGAPVAVQELNVFPYQLGARLSEDMRRVVFHAYTNGLMRLIESTRASSTEAFQAPSFVPGLSTADGGAGEEAAFPTIAPDGRTIYFESNRGGHVQIWWASRPQLDAGFASPAVVAGLDDPQNTGQPYLTGSGDIWFVSRHAKAPNPTSGGIDIYSGTVAGAGTVTQAFERPLELETTDDDYAPVVSADGREAFFSRLVLDNGMPSATFRIWTATRAPGATSWTNLAPAVTLEGPSSHNDLASWLSNDRCTLYLASDREGFYKIYRATRPL